ncbi:MAG: hypothetical protein HPY53_16850 [Brevinematales bacterium]|nr:hypothetical protein [Brevinematales bacterium]
MKEADVTMKDGKIWVNIHLDEQLNFIRKFESGKEAIEYLRQEHILKECA